LNTNVYSHLEASGGQYSYLYLNVVLLSTPVLIRPLWQLKTVVNIHTNAGLLRAASNSYECVLIGNAAKDHALLRAKVVEPLPSS